MRVITLFILSVIGYFTATGQTPKLMLPIGHTGKITSIVFSPDGKRFLTASDDNTVKIWDAAKLILLSEIKNTGSGNNALFSKDGTKIITSSEYADGNFTQIWETETGNRLQVFAGRLSNPDSTAFSADGKRLITRSYDSTAKLWDLENGKLLFVFRQEDNVETALFSPDSKKIVTASQSNIKIWEADKKTLLFDIKNGVYYVKSIAFSPDSKKIVSASNNGSPFWGVPFQDTLPNKGTTAIIWDVDNGVLITKLEGHHFGVTSAIFSTDGKNVVTSSADGTIKIWNSQNGSLFNSLTDPDGGVMIASVSPDRKRIITFSNDSYLKTRLRLWDLEKLSLITSMNPLNSSVNAAVFCPDGQKIFLTNSEVEIWDAGIKGLVGVLSSHTLGSGDGRKSAQFSSDAEKIVVAFGKGPAKVWNVNSGAMESYLGQEISSASFGAQGKKIITTSFSSASIWNTESGAKIFNLFEGKNNMVKSAISVDGRKAIAGFWRVAKLWDEEKGKVIDLDVGGPLESVALSNDGKKAVTLSIDEIKIWNSGTGALISNANIGVALHRPIVLSPDGSKVVVLPMIYDYDIKVWDTEKGVLLSTLKGHTGSVSSVVFSPDGTQLASASADQTAKVWDLKTGTIVRNFKEDYLSQNYVKFSSDGTELLAGGWGFAKIWNIKSQQLEQSIRMNSTHLINDVNWDKKLLLAVDNSMVSIFDLKTSQLLYSFIAVDSSDYLVVDRDSRYDGTEKAIQFLYFTCGNEYIELDQLKKLWVPNLAQRIMSGPAVNSEKLSELDICNALPLINEPEEDKDYYTVKIIPQKDGIGDIVVSVNNIERSRYKSANLIKTANGYVLNLKKQVLFPAFIPGNLNTVSIKAYNLKNTVASKTVTIAYNDKRARVRYPNLYAIMVGINEYKKLPAESQLHYAVDDVESLSELIGSSARQLLNVDGREHVFIYKVTTGKKQQFYPEKNTIRHIIEDSIRSKATVNDIFLIFMSGHGDVVDKDFTFLTVETSETYKVGISTTELFEWSQKIGAAKRVLILDACNSGQVLNDLLQGSKFGLSSGKKALSDNGDRITAIDRLNERSGMYILCASASDQKAREESEYAHGVLTFALLKAIKEKPEILEDGKFLNMNNWFGKAESMVNDLVRHAFRGKNASFLTRQDPKVIGTGNFNIGIVNREIRNKIVLEKTIPTFARSNFQNSKTSIDDLKLRRLIDESLIERGSKDPSAAIIFNPYAEEADSYNISGDYRVENGELIINVFIVKGVDIIAKFTVRDNVDRMTEMISEITLKSIVAVYKKGLQQKDPN